MSTVAACLVWRYGCIYTGFVPNCGWFLFDAVKYGVDLVLGGGSGKAGVAILGSTKQLKGVSPYLQKETVMWKERIYYVVVCSSGCIGSCSFVGVLEIKC